MTKAPPAAVKRAASLLGLVVVLALLAPASAIAVPPLISQTSFSSVTETGATLSAAVDPTNGKTNAHFDYTTLAEYEAHAFVGAKTAPAAEIALLGQVKGKGNLIGPVAASGDLT